jgi:hypothetical protein
VVSKLRGDLGRDSSVITAKPAGGISSANRGTPRKVPTGLLMWRQYYDDEHQQGFYRCGDEIARIVGPGFNRHHCSNRRRYPQCEQGDTWESTNRVSTGVVTVSRRWTPTGLLPVWWQQYKDETTGLLPVWSRVARILRARSRRTPLLDPQVRPPSANRAPKRKYTSRASIDVVT